MRSRRWKMCTTTLGHARRSLDTTQWHACTASPTSLPPRSARPRGRPRSCSRGCRRSCPCGTGPRGSLTCTAPRRGLGCRGSRAWACTANGLSSRPATWCRKDTAWPLGRESSAQEHSIQLTRPCTQTGSVNWMQKTCPRDISSTNSSISIRPRSTPCKVDCGLELTTHIGTWYLRSRRRSYCLLMRDHCRSNGSRTHQRGSFALSWRSSSTCQPCQGMRP